MLVIVQVDDVPKLAHDPPQPVNIFPGAGIAVKTTLLPERYGAEHTAPQFNAPEFAATVPVPVVVTTIYLLFGFVP